MGRTALRAHRGATFSRETTVTRGGWAKDGHPSPVIGPCRWRPLQDPTLQEPVESTPDARWLNRFGHFFARPWLGVLSRTLAAIVGGYALAATCSMFFAVALPIARAQAVLTGMLVAIVLCACAALWAFATRTALRAWLGLALPTALFWLGTIVLGARA
jgi:hypothetical protein